MQDLTNTIRLGDSARGLSAAAALLKQGGLVAFPTETVYGLGADATNAVAVARIFEAKGRPRFNPLIVHVSSLREADRLADIPEQAMRLAKAFWPGALTLVLPKRSGSGLPEITTAGLDTVAVRVPEHPLAHELLREVDLPLAAPSANISGRVSATTADHVMEGLGGRIAGVIDGGQCPIGVESTIIGFESDSAVLLRPGGIPAEEIEAALGNGLAAPAGDKISAPGQMTSHYAPNAQLVLDTGGMADAGALWLAFGPLGGRRGISLSESCDLREAAAALFSTLRDIDHLASAGGIDTVLVDPIPQTGLGHAINDRLQRAAAPRP